MKNTAISIILLIIATTNAFNLINFYASQNYVNTQYSPIIIPNPMNNTASYYLDFYNPYTQNATFTIQITGDNQNPSKNFNYTQSITLQPFQHYRINTTLTPKNPLNSEAYYLTITKNGNQTQNNTILNYYLFQNPTPGNYLDTNYTPVIINNQNTLEVYVDFYNPYQQTDNYTITATNVQNSNAFQTQTINKTLKYLQHAQTTLTLQTNNQPSLTQNNQVVITTYDLTNKKIVSRGVLTISGLALPATQQKTPFQTFQQIFAEWIAILITIITAVIILLEFTKISQKFKNTVKSFKQDIKKIKITDNALKIFATLTTLLLLLQTLNIITAFTLAPLLIITLVLGIAATIKTTKTIKNQN